MSRTPVARSMTSSFPTSKFERNIALGKLTFAGTCAPGGRRYCFLLSFCTNVEGAPVTERFTNDELLATLLVSSNARSLAWAPEISLGAIVCTTVHSRERNDGTGKIRNWTSGSGPFGEVVNARFDAVGNPVPVRWRIQTPELKFVMSGCIADGTGNVAWTTPTRSSKPTPCVPEGPDSKIAIVPFLFSTYAKYTPVWKPMFAT